MKRRIPNRHDLAPLLQVKKPEFNPTRRRLDKALTIEDLRRIAKRRTPRAAFDYTDGSAEAELSITRARQGSPTSSFTLRFCGTCRGSRPDGTSSGDL
jgi:L-lactate dehydrogenase (cytochrome)